MSAAPAAELRARPYRDALRMVVAASSTPYGYTVSIWSTGTILMGAHGVPSGAQVAGFIGGALCGFGLLGLMSLRRLGDGTPLDHLSDRVTAGMLHWIAVCVAVGGGALVARLPAWAAWPLGSFTATTAYLLAASLQLTLITARRTRSRR